MKFYKNIEERMELYGLTGFHDESNGTKTPLWKAVKPRGGEHDRCDNCGQRFDQDTGISAVKYWAYWAKAEHLICGVSGEVCAKEVRGGDSWSQPSPCGRKTKEWIPTSPDQMYTLDAWKKATLVPVCGTHLGAYKRQLKKAAADAVRRTERNRRNDLREAETVYAELAAEILKDSIPSAEATNYGHFAIDPIELFEFAGIEVPDALRNAKADMEQYVVDNKSE